MSGQVRVDDRQVEAFWQWWQTARDGVAVARAAGDHGYRDDVTQALATVHPRLAWDIAPGRAARAAFCLSSLGDPALRRVAVTVAGGAPPPDEAWEVHACRSALPGDPEAIVLRAGDRQVAFADARVSVTALDAREQLALRLWHPELAGWAPEAQRLVLHQLLDVTLGEEGVGRWVHTAEVGPLGDAPSCGLAALRAVVGRLAEHATGDRWQILHGALPDGRPVLVSVNLASKPWDHPLHDSHCEISMPVLRPDARGLPSRDELGWLNQRCDELAYYLGKQAVIVARETGDAQRVLHLFADAAGPAREMVSRWADKQRDREVRASWGYDPAWLIREQWATQLAP